MMVAGSLFIFLTTLPVIRMQLSAGSDYLYESMDPTEAWPIQEYLKPVGLVEGMNEIILPEFLYDERSGHRVVEFYAVRSLDDDLILLLLLRLSRFLTVSGANFTVTHSHGARIASISNHNTLPLLETSQILHYLWM